jgi:hypothetical protein
VPSAPGAVDVRAAHAHAQPAHPAGVLPGAGAAPAPINYVTLSVVALACLLLGIGLTIGVIYLLQ